MSTNFPSPELNELVLAPGGMVQFGDATTQSTAALPLNGTAPMTAELPLAGNAADPLGATPLQQVQGLVAAEATARAAADALLVPLTGATMQGPILMSRDAQQPTEPSTLRQMNASLASAYVGPRPFLPGLGQFYTDGYATGSAAEQTTGATSLFWTATKFKISPVLLANTVGIELLTANSAAIEAILAFYPDGGSLSVAQGPDGQAPLTETAVVTIPAGTTGFISFPLAVSMNMMASQCVWFCLLMSYSGAAGFTLQGAANSPVNTYETGVGLTVGQPTTKFTNTGRIARSALTSMPTSAPNSFPSTKSLGNAPPICWVST